MEVLSKHVRRIPAFRREATPGRGFSMKIKALEITGFKSFYRKTRINFSEGITAVVGPNGCGKSNILDAVKWVIGESNPRLLRAGEMKNIISNGGAELKPLGMADVSLILEGVEGFGFEEVRVRRKLYRSGESEYFINGVRCRQKDITEMFLDTGVGARAYSIVEQGQVESFVTSKPEERRKFIEEIAGIEKYKVRRKETRSRIESTRQNIARVMDMKKEVEDRMEALSQQAERAGEYNRLSEKARILEAGILKEKLGKSRGRKAGLLEKIGGLEQSVSAAERSKREKSLLLEDARKRNSESADGVSAAERKIYEISADIREKRTRRDLIEREIDSASSHADDIRSEIESLELEIADAERKRLESAEQARELGTARFSASEGISAKENELSVLKRRWEESKGELEKVGTEISDVMTQKSSLGSAIGAFSGELEELFQKRESLGEDISSLELEKRERGGELALLLEKQDGIKEEFTAASAEKEKLDSALYDLRVERERMLGGHENLESREKNCVSRMNALNRIQKNYEWLPESTREFVVEKKSGGVLGVVSDFVLVPENYERAVEAAFGEKLNWIVVEQSSEAVQAVELLREFSAGRGTFIPAADEFGRNGGKENGNGKIDAVSLNGLLDVRVIEKDLMDSMLHEVYVTSDLAEALRLKKESGNGACFATLDGDYVDSTGAITGGHVSAGVFERKREIAELEKETAVLGEEIAESKRACDALGEEMDATDDRRAELEESLRRHEIRSVENVKDQSNVRAKIEDLKTRAETLAGELEAVKRKLGSKNSTKEEMESQFADLDGRRASLECIYEEAEKRTTALAGAERSLQEEITNLKIDNASLLEREKALEGDLAGVEKRKAAISDRLSSRRKALEIKKREAESLVLSKEDAESESAELSRSLTLLQSSLEEMKEKAKDLTAEFGREENAFGEASSELELRSGELSDARVELARVEDELLYLGEQCAAVFGDEIPDPDSGEGLSGLSVPEAEKRLRSLRARIENFGPVNHLAPEEHRQLEEREDFLRRQTDDLTEALASLESAVRKLDRESVSRFRESFETINRKFGETFSKLFEGGEAKLELVDPGNLLETGIEVMIRPGGKKFQPINLLSGGEKALSAISVVVSACLVKPAPFLFFDEIDAALDEINTAKFSTILEEIASKSQVVVVTHNKRTMRQAGSLIGITSDGSATSRMVSVKLDS